MAVAKGTEAVDPFAHLYVDDVPAKTREDSDEAKHVAALLESKRAGLRIPLDTSRPERQKSRYQRAAKAVDRSASITLDGEGFMILALAPRRTRRV